MSSYHLLSWGANSHGQLGQGIATEEVTRPEEVSDRTFEIDNIWKIVGGAGHTLILDKNGHVYSCGWNVKGQAGIPGRENIMKFSRIHGTLESEFIVDIACGWDSSAAITKDGKLFVWGSNNFGQLGLPDESGNVLDPTEVAIDEEIATVSMGLRHTAVTTKNHQVFVTGENKKGQLGVASVNEKHGIVREFVKVPLLNDIDGISCGQYHTIAKTKSGKLYAWGNNKYGQLGKKDNASSINEPLPFENFETGENLKIYAGWTHSAVLIDGYIYAWGRNTYGQLGYPMRQSHDNFFTPDKVQCPSKVRQLAVGSQHSIAIIEDGNILSWGWNEHGNCGNGNVCDILLPKPILISKDYDGVLVGTGAGHSFAVVKI